MASPQPPYQQPYPEDPPSSGMSTGTIIAIVAAILFVVLGIPILTCGGCFAWGLYRANQVAQQIDKEFEDDFVDAGFEDMSEREARRLQALKIQLKPVLYEHAKADLNTYYELPSTRRWKGWYVEPVTDQTFAIMGRLEGGANVLQWRCEYSTRDPFNAQPDDWQTERVIVNDEVIFRRGE